MWKRAKHATDEDSKRVAINNLLDARTAMFTERKVLFCVYIAIMDALIVLLLDSIEKGKCGCNGCKCDGCQDVGRSEGPCEAQAGKEKE